MPQIKEYMPRSEVAGPVRIEAPNASAALSVGRGLQNLGDAMANVGDIAQKRE